MWWQRVTTYIVEQLNYVPPITYGSLKWCDDNVISLYIVERLTYVTPISYKRGMQQRHHSDNTQVLISLMCNSNGDNHDSVKDTMSCVSNT